MIEKYRYTKPCFDVLGFADRTIWDRADAWFWIRNVLFYVFEMIYLQADGSQVCVEMGAVCRGFRSVSLDLKVKLIFCNDGMRRAIGRGLVHLKMAIQQSPE